MKPVLIAPVLQNKSKYLKILTYFGSAITRYWPLNEVSGTVVREIKAAKNGTGSGGITWGSYVSPVQAGKFAPTFVAASYGRVDVYDATLTTGDEGFISFWCKLTAGQWAAAGNFFFLNFMTDANNRVCIQKTAGGVWGIHTGNATEVTVSSVTAPQTGNVHFVFTWSVSNNRARLYQMGTQTYLDSAAVVHKVGALSASYCQLGNYGSMFDLDGGLSDVILGNREITQAEVIWLMKCSRIGIKKFGVIGDSKEIEWIDWNYHVSRSYNTGICQMLNHAVTGHQIIANMDGQVAAAAGDGASIIILTLGTNDDNAGNMGTLQAKVESGLAALKISNPAASIYYMNVLPRWTDSGGGTVVDKSNIRAAIAAACTAKGITCWDTFSTPWITAGQTSDGVHPTPAGHTAIATQVLSRI